MPLQPTVTSQGIKYIKVNKQDFNGLNLNVPLSQLDALRIRYSNGTIGQYNLLGEPSEYPDYYLLRVSPNSSFTSSADNTITNYTAVASTGSGAIVTPSSFGETYVLNNLTVSSNPGGYLNGTTGVYDVPSLTNIPIIISSSVNATNPSGFGFPQTLILAIFSSLRGTLSTNSSVITAGNSGNVTSSYSGFMIEGEDITFRWGSAGFGGPLSVNSSTFYVTQSQAPATPSENLVIFEPYNTTNFYNSDYNAITNNSEVNRLSSDYQLVDYATNQLVPVNFTQLLQGIATRASVQDSNYTSYQYSGIRYWGSKNTTDNFNDASVQLASSIQVDKFPSRIGISQFRQPSIDLNQTYFSYFNWAGGTSPDWGDFKNDRTIYSIRFFIDENGNIIRPLNDPDGIALGIMNQNFIEGQNAVSSLLNTNISSYNTSILNSTYPIFKSGKTIQPILYNQINVTGSSGNVTGYTFTESIQFDASVGTTTVSDWSFNVFRVGTQIINRPLGGLTSDQQIQFNGENSDVNNRYSSNEYTFDANTDTNVRFISVLRVQAKNLNIGSQQVVASLEFAIQKSSNNGVTWTNLVTKGNYFPQARVNNMFTTDSLIGDVLLQTPYLSFNALDKVRIALISANIYPNEEFNIHILGALGTINTSTFYNLQDQAPTAAYTASGVFFITGSTPSNILTASVELSNLYGLEIKMQDIQGSGFSPVSYPFIPQPYDEIRFEGIEANSYIITEVEYSGSLFLTLSSPITTNTNINEFLIRRYVDDPAFLILDVDKPAGASGGGIIKPEFIIGRIDQKIDSIVQSLEERGLLPTQ
jgi:hypothetical protein